MIRYICMVLLKYKPHDKLLILNCLHCDPWQFLGTTRGFKVWCKFICLSVQYAIWLWYHPVTKRRGIIFNIRISENIFIQNLFYNIVRILWLHKSLFYHGYYRLGERCCPFASCLTHDIFLIPFFDIFCREGRFVIADIILTYDRYLITSSSVVNNLYMLHRHGFIQNLKIQGDVSYDKCMFLKWLFFLIHIQFTYNSYGKD